MKALKSSFRGLLCKPDVKDSDLDIGNINSYFRLNAKKIMDTRTGHVEFILTLHEAGTGFTTISNRSMSANTSDPSNNNNNFKLMTEKILRPFGVISKTLSGCFPFLEYHDSRISTEFVKYYNNGPVIFSVDLEVLTLDMDASQILQTALRNIKAVIMAIPEDPFTVDERLTYFDLAGMCNNFEDWNVVGKK